MNSIHRTAATLLLGFAPIAGAGPVTLDASAISAAMVAAMNAEPSPGTLKYDETIVPHGLNLRIIDSNGKSAVHLVFSSDATAAVFHVEQGASSQTAQVTDTKSGHEYTSDQLFWSPMWSQTGASPQEQPTVLSAVRTKMLSDVLTMHAGDYTMKDAGVADVNGTPVYHLRLTAVGDAASHPLTDVFVDEQSYLLRRAVAAFSDNTVTSVTGTVTLTFDPVGGYWLITSGEVDATVHAYFKNVSGSATFAASNFEFPTQSP
jgi:hypothetical protein